MQRIKSENEQSSRNKPEIQTHISIRHDRAINFVAPIQDKGSDTDSLESSSDDDQHGIKKEKNPTGAKKKYSDLLYRMIPKIIYKDILLDSKREDYDMFVYKINSKNSKEKESSYVISRVELKKNQVPVDAKPMRCVDKIVFMAK